MAAKPCRGGTEIGLRAKIGGGTEIGPRSNATHLAMLAGAPRTRAASTPRRLCAVSGFTATRIAPLVLGAGRAAGAAARKPNTSSGAAGAPRRP